MQEISQIFHFSIRLGILMIFLSSSIGAYLGILFFVVCYCYNFLFCILRIDLLQHIFNIFFVFVYYYI